MSALLSPCGKYRHRLEREVQPTGIVAAFFGVNPSTAGETEDDATTRKWIGFSLRNGIKKYLVGNPFDYRAVDVRELAKVSEPVSPQNLEHLMRIIADADVLIPCWGSKDKVPPTLRFHLVRLKRYIFESGKPVKIFGLTASGDPKHPLMLSYSTPLTEWKFVP